MPNDARATWIWVVVLMSWERKFAIVFVFYDIKQQIANFRFGEAFVCFLVNSRSISSIWAYNINKHVVKSTKWVSNFNKHVVKSHNCTYDVYKHVVKSLIRSYNLHKHLVKSIIRSYNVNKHVVKSTIWGLTGGAAFFSHPWWGVGEPPSPVFPIRHGGAYRRRRVTVRRHGLFSVENAPSHAAPLRAAQDNAGQMFPRKPSRKQHRPGKKKTV